MASMQLEKPQASAPKAADARSQCCEVNKASAVKEMAMDQTHAQESKHDQLKHAHEPVLTQHAKVGAADEKKKKKEKEKKEEKKKSAGPKPTAKASHKLKEEKEEKEKKEKKEKKKKNKHKDDTSSSSNSDSDGHEHKKKQEGKRFK